MKTCETCKWLESDYEDASDGHWMNKPYVVCRAKNGVSTLKQFPFKNTKCKSYETHQ